MNSPCDPVNEMFTGIEAEGRLKGVHTLFSQRPCKEAVQAAHKYGITHLFFGARGHTLTTDDYFTLKYLCCTGIEKHWIVSVHVHITRASAIPAWIFQRCHILLYDSFESAGSLGLDIEIKLENHKVAAVYSNPQMVDLTYVYDRNIHAPRNEQTACEQAAPAATQRSMGCDAPKRPRKPRD